MSNFFRDIRLAVSTLLRNSGTTTVIIVTLALGIGANSAIFSLLNAVVLRPLPVPHPEQLVGLSTTISDSVNGDEPFSLQMFQELARHQNALSDLFAWDGGNVENLEVDGSHFTAALATVSGDYYKAMRIAPLLGRFIAPADVALNSGTSNAVAVISFRTWRAWYHGDPNVAGKTLRVGGLQFTIIGVEPEGYSGLIIDGSTDVTVPVFAPGTSSSRDPKMLWVEARGRLRPGVTLPQARASLETLLARYSETDRSAWLRQRASQTFLCSPDQGRIREPRCLLFAHPFLPPAQCTPRLGRGFAVDSVLESGEFVDR